MPQNRLTLVSVTSLHTAKVTAAIFEYIRLLKNTQPFPTWVHQEVQKVLANEYRFLEGSSSISDDADVISTSLHEPYSRSQILSAPYRLAEYDPEAIKAVLEYLIKDKAQVFICSHSDIEGLKYDKREKWYGTEYRIDALKPEWFDVSLYGSYYAPTLTPVCLLS